MIKKISLFIIFITFTHLCLAQVDVSRDVLPNTNSADSTAVLNNVLRQNQDAINSIGGYFNSNGYLSPADGGTGTNITNFPNGSILIYSSSNVGIGTFGQGSSGQILYSNGATTNPSFGAFPSYNSILPPFTAGDYFVFGNFVEGSAGGTSPTKAEEIYINRPGIIRIKFYLTKSGGTTAFGQIYRNGSAVGTLQSTASQSLFSEDISGWSAGDLCQLYVYNSNGAQNTYGLGLSLYEGTPITPEVNFSTYVNARMYTGSQAPTTTYSGLGIIGDLFSNTGGGASTTLYVKTASTTWTAK